MNYGWSSSGRNLQISIGNAQQYEERQKHHPIGSYINQWVSIASNTHCALPSWWWRLERSRWNATLGQPFRPSNHQSPNIAQENASKCWAWQELRFPQPVQRFYRPWKWFSINGKHGRSREFKRHSQHWRINRSDPRHGKIDSEESSSDGTFRFPDDPNDEFPSLLKKSQA